MLNYNKQMKYHYENSVSAKSLMNPVERQTQEICFKMYMEFSDEMLAIVEAGKKG